MDGRGGAVVDEEAEEEAVGSERGKGKQTGKLFFFFPRGLTSQAVGAAPASQKGDDGVQVALGGRAIFVVVRDRERGGTGLETEGELLQSHDGNAGGIASEESRCGRRNARLRLAKEKILDLRCSTGWTHLDLCPGGPVAAPARRRGGLCRSAVSPNQLSCCFIGSGRAQRLQHHLADLPALLVNRSLSSDLAKLKYLLCDCLAPGSPSVPGVSLWSKQLLAACQAHKQNAAPSCPPAAAARSRGRMVGEQMVPGVAPEKDRETPGVRCVL